MKYAYAPGASTTSEASRVSGLIDITATTRGTRYAQNSPWSGDWKYEAVYNAQKIDLNMIVENYESFDSMSLPMFVAEDPQGRVAKQPSNGYMKLGSLLF